jgi:hypothetical protein
VAVSVTEVDWLRGRWWGVWGGHEGHVGGVFANGWNNQTARMCLEPGSPCRSLSVHLFADKAACERWRLMVASAA